ncbi:MAG TPA: twin-arginine translocation signal domain-containing protein [Verrucomicrobiae bacterium]|nr:twin-arginine translocation signal domain-containing protein [Verrucomicrobiae bacterium]
MKIKQDFEQLLRKDMDRRDFLKHVGIGFAAILGITAMLKTLSSVMSPGPESIGYGSSTYGGVRPNTTPSGSATTSRQGSKLA